MAVNVVDGILYAIGGATETSAHGSPVSVNEAYNPETDAWMPGTPMPTARYGARAAAIDRVLYVVGGNNSVVEAYDSRTHTWTGKPSMPTPRMALSVVAVDNILYAIGGFRISVFGTWFNTVEAYDPETNAWTTKASMPTTRCCMAAGVIDGLIYVAGGFRGVGSVGIEEFNTLEVYDPKTDTWITKAPMPIRGGVIGGVIDGKLYAIGGRPDFVTVVAYNPANDSWTAQTSLPTRRTSASTGIVNDSLYVLGGFRGNEPLSLNEAFNLFLSVAIDIKPGDAANTINLRARGTVQVATLSSPTFDASTVNPDTVTLAGAGVTTTGRGTPLTTFRDVNRDGRLDLLLHFRTQDLELTPTSTEAVLKGRTFSGQLIRGVDSVRIVP